MAEEIVLSGWQSRLIPVAAAALFCLAFWAGARITTWRVKKLLGISPLSDDEIRKILAEKRSAAIGVVTAALEEIHDNDPDGQLVKLTREDEHHTNFAAAAAYQAAQREIILYLIGRLSGAEEREGRAVWQSAAADITGAWYEDE